MSKILVIWDVMLDKYSYWDVKRLNPEWPNPLLNITKEEFRLWGSANVAANISSLNWSCDLIWLVWNDKNKWVFSKLCDEKNINFIEIITDFPTITKQRFIENTYKQQLLRVDYEENMNLSKNNLLNILAYLENNNYEYIVISDYNKWIITDELISNIKKLDIKILVDSKPKNVEFFKDTFLVKPNFKEFCEMIWKNITNTDTEIEKYWTQFVKEMNTNLVVTRWKAWASIITKNLEYFHIETQAKEVFDVTWAWDTFIATIAFALANNYSLIDSVKLWNKASWIVIWKTWTEIITKKELF